MKIATFGSCLSRFTAIQYTRLFGGEIVGSVYHNRADRFMKTYIERSETEVPASLFDGIALEDKTLGKAGVMIRNQVSVLGLGRHGMTGEMGDNGGFMEAIEGHLDLIIMDNYVDLVARLCTISDLPGSSGLFVVPDEVPSLRDRLILEPRLVDIAAAVQAWHALVDWVRGKQPGTKIFFIPFPFDHHPKTDFVARSRLFDETFTTTRIKRVPLMQVYPGFVESPSHFSTSYYAMLAAYIRHASTARKRKTASEAADDILNAPKRAQDAPREVMSAGLKRP
jgi:hypothetical protein